VKARILGMAKPRSLGNDASKSPSPETYYFKKMPQKRNGFLYKNLTGDEQAQVRAGIKNEVCVFSSMGRECENTKPGKNYVRHLKEHHDVPQEYLNTKLFDALKKKDTRAICSYLYDYVEDSNAKIALLCNAEHCNAYVWMYLNCTLEIPLNRLTVHSLLPVFEQIESQSVLFNDKIRELSFNPTKERKDRAFFSMIIGFLPCKSFILNQLDMRYYKQSRPSFNSFNSELAKSYNVLSQGDDMMDLLFTIHGYGVADFEENSRLHEAENSRIHPQTPLKIKRKLKRIVSAAQVDEEETEEENLAETENSPLDETENSRLDEPEISRLDETENSPLPETENSRLDEVTEESTGQWAYASGNHVPCKQCPRLALKDSGHCIKCDQITCEQCKVFSGKTNEEICIDCYREEEEHDNEEEHGNEDERVQCFADECLASTTIRCADCANPLCHVHSVPIEETLSNLCINCFSAFNGIKVLF